MRRNICAGSALFCAIAFATSASAQIFYQPVRYQYGEQQTYYYGGSDPRVHAFAHDHDCDPTFGRVNGWSFASGDIDRHREVVETRPRIYSDCIPFRNAWVYGMTASDAANTANANVPRYFRKADLLADATILPDGSVIVPPQAGGTSGTIDIRRVDRSARILHRLTPAPTTQPHPLMIIPKDMLDRPLAKPDGNRIAENPADSDRKQG